jgi:hypothetical protein
MSPAATVGYQLGKLRETGQKDAADHLASTTLSSIVRHYMEDGWTDDALRDTVASCIDNERADFDEAALDDE